MVNYVLKILKGFNVFFLFFKIKIKKNKLSYFESEFHGIISEFPLAVILVYFKKESEDFFHIKMFLGVLNLFSIKKSIWTTFMLFFWKEFDYGSNSIIFQEIRILKSKNLKKLLLENNKNYTVEYYDLQRYGIDCQVAYGFLIHHEVEGFGFDYYLGLLVKNLKVKKVIRVDNFKPHQKFSVARECILFNKIRSNLGFLHTYSVQKKKIFLYFHLLQSFFSCQDSYSDYHDFLWLKYGPRYIYMRNIRSYIQKKIEAIRLRLFMDFKINFDIYFEKIKIFFSEKFYEYSHIAREINFFIRENKERILNFIKENIDLFFFDDDLSILTYGNWDYLYFKTNCLQKRICM